MTDQQREPCMPLMERPEGRVMGDAPNVRRRQRICSHARPPGCCSAVKHEVPDLCARTIPVQRVVQGMSARENVMELLQFGKIDKEKFGALLLTKAFTWDWSIRSEKSRAAWELTRGPKTLR